MKLSYLAIALLSGTIGLTGCQSSPTPLPLIQAHRGGAALYPENTIPAMLHAVEIGIPVLEMDLQITRDSQVVVSHDPYLNPLKVLTPEGTRIAPENKRSLRIGSMDYDSLRRYDVGSLPRDCYPDRKNLRCAIPLATELIDSVEQYTRRKQFARTYYNIEIKCPKPAKGEPALDYRTRADLCMKALLSRQLGERLQVQCFDARTLNYLHRQYPEVRLAYNVGDEAISFEEQMARLDFTPQVYSPESHTLDAETVRKARERGMKIVPWTVDERDEALRMKSLGVDAIITNRPDSMQVWIGQ